MEEEEGLDSRTILGALVCCFPRPSATIPTILTLSESRERGVREEGTIS